MGGLTLSTRAGVKAQQTQLMLPEPPKRPAHCLSLGGCLVGNGDAQWNRCSGCPFNSKEENSQESM